MNAWLKRSEVVVLGQLNLTHEQVIACACLGMAQLGFMAILFNVYRGLTGL